MKESTRRFRAVRPRTLRQEVGDILREAILSAKLEPGQRLIEDELARDLEISRIPIREALGQLAQQGLVTIVPHQGASVIRPTQSESHEALVVRMHLESLAAKLAAARHDLSSLNAMNEVIARMTALADNKEASAEQTTADLAALDWEFHQRLIAASGSAVLNWIWSAIGPCLWVTDRYGRILRQNEQNLCEPPQTLIQERVMLHQFVLEALRSGDVHRAEQAVQQHYARVMSKDPLPDASLLAALPWLGDAIQATKADAGRNGPVAGHYAGL